jgi:hypothetical protein
MRMHYTYIYTYVMYCSLERYGIFVRAIKVGYNLNECMVTRIETSDEYNSLGLINTVESLFEDCLFIFNIPFNIPLFFTSPSK